MRPLSSAFTTGLIALLAVACGGSSDEDFPDTTPFPSAMADRLHQIRDRVAEIRGLPINEDAEEGLITTEALQEYGRGQFEALEDEDAEDIRASEATLELMGLVPAGFSFEDDYLDESGELVAGVYYFEVDRLVLVGDLPEELTLSQELTLAHEYVHSMQDAEYNLDEFYETWTESDLEEDGYTGYLDTLQCLIEGDAEFTQRLYAEEVFGEDWQEQIEAESADDEPLDVDIPEFLMRDFVFNYRECETFVDELYEEGGWDAVNAAYEDPPATTEQVLHPDKYYSGELARSRKPASLSEDVDGWGELDSVQFGEFDVFNYVLSLSGDFTAAAVGSQGWGAGWSYVYRDEDDPSQVVSHLRLDWDTEQDYFEFLGALIGVLQSYGVAPEDIEVDEIETLRWEADADFDQYGALVLDEELQRVEMIFAVSEDARETFVGGL